MSDLGVGIYETLKGSRHKPRTHVDAITLATREGVTRDPMIGQGNGLWGLLGIARNNSGRLSITSGSGSVFFKEDEVLVFNNIPYLDQRVRGTIVDFQIDAGKAVDVPSALGGHRPVNLVFEQLEDDSGDYSILVAEHAHGTGTRRSAVSLRNLIRNLLTERSQRVVLDFSGLGIVSSSFADELLGKLVVQYGFVAFHGLFSLKGMSPMVQAIVNRSIAQRLAESVGMLPSEKD